MSSTQDAQNKAGEAAEGTKQFGAEKTGQAQQAGSDASKTTQAKAGEAKEKGGSVLDQAGAKATDTFNAAKNALGGK